MLICLVICSARRRRGGGIPYSAAQEVACEPVERPGTSLYLLARGDGTGVALVKVGHLVLRGRDDGGGLVEHDLHMGESDWKVAGEQSARDHVYSFPIRSIADVLSSEADDGPWKCVATATLGWIR